MYFNTLYISQNKMFCFPILLICDTGLALFGMPGIPKMWLSRISDCSYVLLCMKISLFNWYFMQYDCCNRYIDTPEILGKMHIYLKRYSISIITPCMCIISYNKYFIHTLHKNTFLMIYILCVKVQYLLSCGQLCAVIAANDDERANGRWGRTVLPYLAVGGRWGQCRTSRASETNWRT